MKPIIKLVGITGLFLSVSFFIDAVISSAVAQITANPNDAGTVVNQSGNSLNIQGGTEAGKNLHHSFDKFGVNQGQTVNFISKPEIENILGRVTGGDASVINGLIKVTGGNSNLYLINPAGIIFGSGASLDVPAAFTATTASGVGFGDNWFKAFGENDYASLVENPDSFAFTQAGTIFNSADLAVKEGQSLTLLGGTVISTGTLKAPGGNINIEAVPEDNLVRIEQEGNLLSLGFPQRLPEETKTIVNNQRFTPLSLPKLLTGGNLSDATGVEVDENGVVKLTGSGVEISNDAGTTVVSNKIDASSETKGKINIGSDDGNTILDGSVDLFGDVDIDGETILSGDITTDGGDISLRTSISDLTKDITISTGETVAGDIRIGYKSLSSTSAQPHNLTLVAGTGNVDFDANSEANALESLSIDGNNVTVSGSANAIANNVEINAKNDIEIGELEANGDVTLEADRNIIIKARRNLEANGGVTLEADRDIIMEANSNLEASRDLKLQARRNISATGSQLTANRDINIIATNKVEIRDSDNTSAIITSERNLLIRGDERINIQAFISPDSIFKSGNKLTLTSDGDIVGNAKFESGVGGFNTTDLRGGEGNFQQTLTPSTDTTISSEGNVNFGDYDGLSLKIEAKGSITGGDITINGSNPNLTGSDSDIELLTKGPGLVLRAGLEELQNKLNIPSQKVGDTNFTSTTNPSSQGDIQVGNVNTAIGGPGGSVTMSATGNINTGNIKTGGNRNIGNNKLENQKDGFVDLQATGDIEVKTISIGSVRDTGGSAAGVGGDIKIIAGGLFRATDSFLETDRPDTIGGIGANGRVKDIDFIYGKKVFGVIPTSIYTSNQPSVQVINTISIKHGGSSFIVGPTFRNAEDNSVLGENSKLLLTVDMGEDNFFGLNNTVTTSDIASGSNNITNSTSFTAGAITSNRNDGGAMSSFRDSVLKTTTSTDSDIGTDRSLRIEIISEPPKNTEVIPSESIDETFSGTNENNIQVSSEQQSISNQQSNPEQPNSFNQESTPNLENVQRQLTEKEQNDICSRINAATAANRKGNTRRVKAANNDLCKTTINNDNNNILKVIPDNRFDDNSILPNIRVR